MAAQGMLTGGVGRQDHEGPGDSVGGETHTLAWGETAEKEGREKGREKGRERGCVEGLLLYACKCHGKAWGQAWGLSE